MDAWMSIPMCVGTFTLCMYVCTYIHAYVFCKLCAFEKEYFDTCNVFF